MRTFVAIKINATRILEEAIRTLHFNLRGEKITWVDIRNLHLTLFFLGEIPDFQINPIADGLRGSVKESKSLRITLSGMGLFRNVRDPRVIWIGVEDNSALVELQSRIADLLVGLGYRKEKRPYRPHLTIGRVKSIYNRELLREEMEKNKDQVLQESVIHEVVFYESILRKEGPQYRIIEAFQMSQEGQT